jgi:glycosyltransferase involved in cell wall biosynthesis
VSLAGLRLLLVTPWFLPDSGGVERHVYETGLRLVRRDVEVTVLTADRTRSLPRDEEHEGLRIERVPAWPAQRDYLLAPDVYRRIRQGDWDVVHVQSWHTAVAPLAMFGAGRGRVPYLVTPHGRGYSSPLRRWLRPAQRRLLGPLLAGAAFVVALTEAERGDLCAELGLASQRVVVVPNGGSLADVAPPSRVEPTPHRRLTIVSVGRLERFKGHHRVIAAVPHVAATYPDVQLRILGAGPYESELRLLAAKAGVAERVSIESFAMHEHGRLAEALATADVGVLLSEFETQPIALLEMAASGLPLVVADSPGLRDAAAEGWAIAVASDAPATLVAEAVRRALEDPPSAAAPRLQAWDETVDALARLYVDAVWGV